MNILYRRTDFVVIISFYCIAHLFLFEVSGCSVQLSGLSIDDSRASWNPLGLPYNTIPCCLASSACFI